MGRVGPSIAQSSHVSIHRDRMTSADYLPRVDHTKPLPQMVGKELTKSPVVQAARATCRSRAAFESGQVHNKRPGQRTGSPCRRPCRSSASSYQSRRAQGQSQPSIAAVLCLSWSAGSDFTGRQRLPPIAGSDGLLSDRRSASRASSSRLRISISIETGPARSC
jgi:hypothetical protein